MNPSTTSNWQREVAILLPCYRHEISPYEAVALDRCRTVLADYPRFLVVPHRLDPARFLDRDPELRVLSFDDFYFSSIAGYSLLCRKAEFYERFLDYRYMLIYQLDAYVFEDQLLEWCRKGFDYIGGPWPNFEFQTRSLKRWARCRLLRPLFRRVGNGGFSLRRVRTFYRASRWLAPWLQRFRGLPEDVFWCNIACYLYPFIRYAPFDQALAFAFDASPAECLTLTGGRLPFGCHAWSTEHLAFWKDKIQELA